MKVAPAGGPRRRLVRFLWRHVILLFSLAVLVAVRVQSGSWWWALLAFAAAPLAPNAVFAFQGVRAGRRDYEPQFIAVPEVDDDEQSRGCVADLQRSREELIRSGSARIEFVRDMVFDKPDWGHGPLTWVLNKFLDGMRHQLGEGVIDLDHNRAMLDFGFYACRGWSGDDQLEADDRHARSLDATARPPRSRAYRVSFRQS